MKKLRERMEDDRVKGIISPSTEWELKKMLIDNFIFGFGFSICVFGTIPLDGLAIENKHIPFALAVALLLIINILRAIYLMGSLVSGKLAYGINRGDGNQICRDCGMRKGMLYFLMLYCPYNPSRANRVLQLIQHDLITNTPTPTSTHTKTVDSFKIISPSTEAKLIGILMENAMCGFLCLGLFTVLVVMLRGMEIPNSRVIMDLDLLWVLGFLIPFAVMFVNGFLTALLDMGDADRVCKLLRMKLVSHFFLLHINSRTRMKNLLPLIDDELQLQRSLVR